MLAIALVALVLAGCGEHRARTTASRIHEGAALFEHACAACHTLNAKTTTAIGGDLAQPVLSIPDLVSLGRIMPAKLTPAQLLTVARYLHAIETTTKERARS